jgi:hypothetical protein
MENLYRKILACLGRLEDITKTDQLEKIIKALTKYSEELVVLKARDELRAEVCNHLMEPRSERGTVHWKENVYEPLWENFDLQLYYRSLDFLIKHKKEMELDIFNRVADLFNQELDLIMFDTTTLLHWGDGGAR